MTGSDWIGVVLLVGDAALVVACLVLVALGWWWMFPFALMCGVAGVLVGRELWADWR